MQKIIAGIMGLFLIWQGAYAQNQVKGRVIDAFSKEALAGVNIQLLHTSKGTATGPDGTFTLPSPTGSDSIRLTYVGYTTQKRALTDNVLIQLFPAASPLNQVVVSASRGEQIRTDAPVAISVLSRQVLQETKAVSLDQVLNKVSGVYMVNLGNEQHTMAIRQPIGYRSLFLYLEDGIPIRTSGDFNHNALIEINMAALKTIEVIRGPASSLYGSEAIGGAINFITQAPAKVPLARLQLETSNQGYKRTDFSFSGSSGKLGWYAGGYYAAQRDGFISHSDFHKLALTLRADYQLSDKSKVIAAASLVDYQTDQTGGLDSTRFFRKDYSSLQTFTYRKVNALRLRSTLEHTWNGHNNTSVHVFFRNNAIGQNPFYAIRNVAGNPLQARGEINTDGFQSYGLIAQHKKTFNRLDAQVIGGISVDNSPASYQASYIGIDRSPAGVYTAYTPSDSLLTDYAVNLLNTAAYAQLEANPAEKLKLVAALRYDRLDYRFDNHLAPGAFTGAPDEKNKFSNFSPKLGLTYDFGGNIGAYGNLSVGFAPPQITDLYRGVQVPTLQAADYLSYEAGAWLSLDQNKAYLDLSLYQLQGKNEIISVRLPDGSYQNQNAGKTIHQGVEYSLRYTPLESLNLRVSGANALHRFRHYMERGKDFNGKEMATAPRFIGNAELTWKPLFAKGLRLSGEWQHVSKYYMDAANTEFYKGYDLLHARAGYTWQGFEVWGNATNLTNQLYATTADKFSYGKSYRQGNPRTFHLGIGYTFTGKEK